VAVADIFSVVQYEAVSPMVINCLKQAVEAGYLDLCAKAVSGPARITDQIGSAGGTMSPRASLIVQSAMAKALLPSLVYPSFVKAVSAQDPARIIREVERGPASSLMKDLFALFKLVYDDRKQIIGGEEKPRPSMCANLHVSVVVPDSPWTRHAANH